MVNTIIAIITPVLICKVYYRDLSREPAEYEVEVGRTVKGIHEPTVLHTVADIYKHELFNEPNRYYDVALILLEKVVWAQ